MNTAKSLLNLGLFALAVGALAQQPVRSSGFVRERGPSRSRPVAYDMLHRVQYDPTPSVSAHSPAVRYLRSGPARLAYGPPAPRWATAEPDVEQSVQDVFGTDDRSQITSTSIYPWSTHCDLIITWPNGDTSGGSATIIDENAAITAGHCVYNEDKGGWAVSIQVVPGRNGATWPFGSVWATNTLSWTGWTNSANRDDDMGVIRLSTTVGNSTGWLGLAAFSDNQDKTGNLSGYPGDKGGTTQWYDSDPINNQTANRLYYRIDTNDGQSGSGVYRIIDGDRYVVGAHSGVSSLISGQWNRATRVTSDKFDDIVDFID
jgi:V8-like Glu-specific endopeptidase